MWIEFDTYIIGSLYFECKNNHYIPNMNTFYSKKTLKRLRNSLKRKRAAPKSAALLSVSRFLLIARILPHALGSGVVLDNTTGILLDSDVSTVSNSLKLVQRNWTIVVLDGDVL